MLSDNGAILHGKEETMTDKERMISMLLTLERDTEGLRDFLETSDFFTAPAASKAAYHGAVRGGLCRHTLNVASMVQSELSNLKLEDKQESGLLAAVCHDLCKVDFYVEEDDPPSQPQLNFLSSLSAKNGYQVHELDLLSKSNCSAVIDWLKNNPSKPKPELSDVSWVIKDAFPFGHGEKSALVASRYVDLTDEELCAVRFHMGPWDAGIVQDHGTKKAFELARERYPLVDVLMSSDYRAAMYERMGVEL